MSAGNGGMPAFPWVPTGEVGLPGLSRREYFAALAMQGLLSNLAAIRQLGFRDSEIEEFAVMRADALLAKLTNGPRADAAPDLLAALHEYHDDDDIGRRTDSPRYRMAREAIEAAEGAKS